MKSFTSGFTFLNKGNRFLMENQSSFYGNRGWSGGAMVLGKLPVPGRPTILITVGLWESGVVGWCDGAG